MLFAHKGNSGVIFSFDERLARKQTQNTLGRAVRIAKYAPLDGQLLADLIALRNLIDVRIKQKQSSPLTGQLEAQTTAMG